MLPNAVQKLIPREFTEHAAKPLRLDDARSIVGNWLAFTRKLGPAQKALVLANRPPIVTKAYVLSNQERDIDPATKKRMGKAGNAVPHVRRSIASRLDALLAQKLPDNARIILRQVKPKHRPAITTAFLEIPVPAFPTFVSRFKASYSSAHFATVCTTRGYAKHPPGAPRTHSWRKISPKALPSLHPIAQAFIHALQASNANAHSKAKKGM